MLLCYNTRVLLVSDNVVCHFLLICSICDLHLYSKFNDRNWQPRVVRHNSDPIYKIHMGLRLLQKSRGQKGCGVVVWQFTSPQDQFFFRNMTTD